MYIYIYIYICVYTYCIYNIYIHIYITWGQRAQGSRPHPPPAPASPGEWWKPSRARPAAGHPPQARAKRAETKPGPAWPLVPHHHPTPATSVNTWACCMLAIYRQLVWQVHSSLNRASHYGWAAVRRGGVYLNHVIFFTLYNTKQCFQYRVLTQIL